MQVFTSYSELAKKAESMIELVRQGIGSQYMNFEFGDDDTTWTLRVSDHYANPQRVTENTIVLVVDVDAQESEEHTNWGRSEKVFSDVKWQYKLDDENCDVIFGDDLESIFENII